MRSSHPEAPLEWLEKRSDGLPNRLEGLSNPSVLPPLSHPVSHIMTCHVATLHQTATLQEATQFLLAKKFSGAPVIGDEGRAVGMISKTDLLEAWQAIWAAASRARLPDSASHDGARAIEHAARMRAASQVTVKDLMMPFVMAVQSSAPISLAASLMAYESVHRLVVLGTDKRMVGIVTSLDILRWIAQLSGFCVPRALRATSP